MNDYSDLFFTMASIVIFSFLLMQSNQAIFHNDVVQVHHEYEKTAVSIAQSLIDEARRKTFDESLQGNGTVNVPGDFRQNLGPPENMERPDFSVFDHYHGYQETIMADLGPYEVDATVTYVSSEPPYVEVTGPTIIKRLEVNVRSIQSDRNVRLRYLKTHY